MSELTGGRWHSYTRNGVAVPSRPGCRGQKKWTMRLELMHAVGQDRTQNNSSKFVG